MINNRISAGGTAVALALIRVFTEAAALPGESTGYGMQRFTVIVLAFALEAVVYLPLLLVSERLASPAAAGGNRILYGFTGVILSVYLLFCAAETGLRTERYAQVMLPERASSVYFFILTGAALIYAVFKGIEAASRTALITWAGFAGLLLLIVVSLSAEINTDSLYPAFIDEPDTLWREVTREFSRGSEYLVIAVLWGNVRNGRRAVPLYLGLSCGTLLIMTFLYNTVLGRLTSEVGLPFYTLSSISDIVLLHRINGIDAMVWTAAGILRTAFFAFAAGAAAENYFGAQRKASVAVSLIFAALSLVLAWVFGAFPELYTPLARISGSGLPLAFTAVFIPLAAALGAAKKGKEAAE